MFSSNPTIEVKSEKQPIFNPSFILEDEYSKMAFFTVFLVRCTFAAQIFGVEGPFKSYHPKNLVLNWNNLE